MKTFVGIIFIGYLLSGCAGHPVQVDSKVTTVGSSQDIKNRIPSSTFANEALYNRGFDAAVSKQLGDNVVKLCRCNDPQFSNRIGIAGITETARADSTFEYILGCGVRTSSENFRPEALITTAPCKSFDLL